METIAGAVFLVIAVFVLVLAAQATHRLALQLTTLWYAADTWYIKTGQDDLRGPKPRYVRYTEWWLDRAEKK